MCICNEKVTDGYVGEETGGVGTDRYIERQIGRKYLFQKIIRHFSKWIWQGKYGVETFDKQKLNVKDDTQIFSST